MVTSADDVRKTIIEILADLCDDFDFDTLDDTAPFRDQLDLDSMDMLDVVLGLRKHYILDIPESDYPQLQTMESSIQYILDELAKQEK
ncbi:MAG: acyl carrier protein [Thermoguttaceae bacterium]|jgi:acyl carrier protein